MNDDMIDIECTRLGHPLTVLLQYITATSVHYLALRNLLFKVAKATMLGNVSTIAIIDNACALPTSYKSFEFFKITTSYLRI